MKSTLKDNHFIKTIKTILCAAVLAAALAGFAGCGSGFGFGGGSSVSEELSGTGQGAAEETGEAEEAMEMKIIVATDFHYLSSELTDYGEYFTNMVENADGKVMMYSEELIDAFLSQVIEKKPDALVISGDLTFNGEKLSHETLSKKLSAVEEEGISVCVMPGNHDIDRSSAAKFVGDGYEYVDSVTADEFVQLYAQFGYDEAVSRDDASLSYMVNLSSDLSLLLVDVNTDDASGDVKEETLEWIRARLEEASREGVHVIAVSHQNLLVHSSLMSSGFIIGNADELLECYEEYADTVVCNLSGHIHMQHIAQSDSGLKDIVTSSLAVSPNQYGVLEVADSQITYSTEVTDVSSWAAAQGLEDANLLDFAAYSAEFFRATCENQALAQLGDMDGADEMAELFAEVNAAYFAGRLDTLEIDDEVAESWRQSGTFLGSYIDSILNDEAGNSCEAVMMLE